MADQIGSFRRCAATPDVHISQAAVALESVSAGRTLSWPIVKLILSLLIYAVGSRSGVSYPVEYTVSQIVSLSLIHDK